MNENTEEIWKDVVGYEGYYQVSNSGKIKRIVSYKCLSERLICPKLNRGYYRVTLSRESKIRVFSVHRLVAISFLANPNEYKQVNHKDGDKANNHLSNLEWCTPSQNIKHSYEVLKRKISPNCIEYGGNHPASVPIMQYSLSGEFIREWDSVIEIQRSLNIKSPNVIACCRGKQSQSGGFIWKHKYERKIRCSRTS